MKRWAIVAAAVGAAALSVAAPVPVTPPGDKPASERWEYAEASFIPPGRGLPIVIQGGNALPPAPANPRALWVTAEEEVEAGSWEELATKLKVPEGPKSDSAAVYKLRVLNHLGKQGWEMVSAAQPTSVLGNTVTTFVFKRKVK